MAFGPLSDSALTLQPIRGRRFRVRLATVNQVPAQRPDPRIAGFTLLEIMIALAIIGSLLVTLICTLNYHLSLAERQEFYTIGSLLAREKITEMEQQPVKAKGEFPEPYARYQYSSEVKESRFQGMSEISVIVSNGKESVKLMELIRNKR